MSTFKNLFTSKKKDLSKLIFELYYKSAFQCAYHYCGDPIISEEAAQEAIFKAIQNLDQLKDANKIEPWIKRIAINNVNAIINKRKNIVSLESVGPILDSLENSPEYVVQNAATSEAVNEAVNSLDPLMRQTIYLYYYREMRVKDISIFLDKPEGTVKTILHRGRMAIRNRLVMKGYIIKGSEGGLKVE